MLAACRRKKVGKRVAAALGQGAKTINELRDKCEGVNMSFRRQFDGSGAIDAVQLPELYEIMYFFAFTCPLVKTASEWKSA